MSLFISNIFVKMPPKKKGESVKKTGKKGGRPRKAPAKSATPPHESDDDVDAAIAADVDAAIAKNLQEQQAQMVEDLQRADDQSTGQVDARLEEIAAQADEDVSQTANTETRDDASAHSEDVVAPAAKKRRKAKTTLDVDDDVKQELAEWYEAHPFFYDKKEKHYKDASYKDRVLAEKAAELSIRLNKDILFKNLKQWFADMRTQFVRDKKKSGAGAGDCESYGRILIAKRFHFFYKHTKIHAQRATLGMRQVVAEPMDSDVEEVVVEEHQAESDPAAEDVDANAHPARPHPNDGQQPGSSRPGLQRQRGGLAG